MLGHHFILDGLKVVEFTQAVMGPVCGLFLASNGADVTLVEPPEGNPTRYLTGFGSAYFPFFNRNKKSLTLDLKTSEGHKVALKLVEQADILIENFAPGTMERLGLGYAKVSEINPKLIYCSLKGFLKGKYENRHAMDEVVQMMGGLAYMTGLPNRPLRVGTSAIDITGGMFGYIGILQALLERQQTGKGKFIRSSLFETVAFFMGQHLTYSVLEKSPLVPMSVRVPAWSVYRYFETLDARKVFIGIISDRHWERFCKAFGKKDFLNNPKFKSNTLRVENRKTLIPALEKLMVQYSAQEIYRRCEKAQVPFAPVNKPEDLLEDEHLNESGFLEELPIFEDVMGKLPKIPLAYGDELADPGQPAPEAGKHTNSILTELGLEDAQINRLREQGVI